MNADQAINKKSFIFQDDCWLSIIITRDDCWFSLSSKLSKNKREIKETKTSFLY